MNLNTLCGTVKTALETVTGLTVDLYQAHSSNPPQAWVQATDYTPETFGDTTGTVPIRVVVGVSQAIHEDSYAATYTLVSDDTLGAALRNAGLQIATLTYTSIGEEFPIGDVNLRGFEILMDLIA